VRSVVEAAYPNMSRPMLYVEGEKANTLSLWIPVMSDLNSRRLGGCATPDQEKKLEFLCALVDGLDLLY
jgi:hypothetical protein